MTHPTEKRLAPYLAVAKEKPCGATPGCRSTLPVVTVDGSLRCPHCKRAEYPREWLGIPNEGQPHPEYRRGYETGYACGWQDHHEGNARDPWSYLPAEDDVETMLFDLRDKLAAAWTKRRQGKMPDYIGWALMEVLRVFLGGKPGKGPLLDLKEGLDG